MFWPDNPQLPDESLVIVVRPDPKPDHNVVRQHAKNAIVTRVTRAEQSWLPSASRLIASGSPSSVQTGIRALILGRHSWSIAFSRVRLSIRQSKIMREPTMQDALSEPRCSRHQEQPCPDDDGLRWLARRAHRPVRDVRRRWLPSRQPSRAGPWPR
jgi:hypothetical protein